MSAWKNTRLIGYGVLIGTAGIKALSSKGAKKVYTHIVAAAKRGIDELAITAAVIKENCEDINAEADEINERIYAEQDAQLIEDAIAVLEEEDIKVEKASTAKAKSSATSKTQAKKPATSRNKK